MIKRNNNPYGDSQPQDYKVFFGGIFYGIKNSKEVKINYDGSFVVEDHEIKRLMGI